MREEETPDTLSLLPSKVCVAVPERFYELLRSVHGVVCEDLETVSFQPAADPDRLLLLHHHSYARESGLTDDVAPRPIEFRRKVIAQTAEEKVAQDGDPPISLMQKLMLEQQTFAPLLVVEVHPIKLFYSCTASTEGPVAVTENGHGPSNKLNGNTISTANLQQQQQQIRLCARIARYAGGGSGRGLAAGCGAQPGHPERPHLEQVGVQRNGGIIEAADWHL